MNNFFDEIDMIYCLCIPERKKFVTEQIQRLNISSKVKIIDAYTPTSPIVNETITNHMVLCIHTNNPIHVSSSLGIREIMIDIVKNKYNYALIMEDDVIFLDDMMEHGNKWIKKSIINEYFEVEKPYILYLQSSKPPEIYYNKIKKPNGGICYKHVRYGEPIYIINHSFCSLLLKHIFPITAPFDEYKHVIKMNYQVKEAILVPYICRELSANYFKYDTSKLNYSFVRTIKLNKENIHQINGKSPFYLSTNSNHQKLFAYIIKCINPNINTILNDPYKPSNIIHYSIGDYVSTLGNNYIISGTIDQNINYINNPTFIISVRGKKSFNIIKNKFGFDPIIGDVLLLFNKFVNRNRIITQKYCFIYDKKDLKIVCNDKFKMIDPSNTEIITIINIIASSEYVVTDNINYITVGNSYSVPGIYATLTDTINDYYDAIAMDYYSNITDQKIEPIKLQCQNDTITINNDIDHKIKKFIQPILPIKNTMIMQLYDIMPFKFDFMKTFRIPDKYVQIF